MVFEVGIIDGNFKLSASNGGRFFLVSKKYQVLVGFKNRW